MVKKKDNKKDMLILICVALLFVFGFKSVSSVKCLQTDGSWIDC